MYVMGIATSVTINLPFTCGARCIIKYISKLYSKLLSLQQIDIMKFLSLHLYCHYAEYHFVIIRGLIMSKHRLRYVKSLSYVGCLLVCDLNRTPNCYGKTWRLLCPFFRNLHLRENLARDCFTFTASTVTNSAQNSFTRLRNCDK